MDNVGYIPKLIVFPVGANPCRPQRQWCVTTVVGALFSTQATQSLLILGYM